MKIFTTNSNVLSSIFCGTSILSISTISVYLQVIPESPFDFGTVYHRGGTYHAVNFHLHAPAEHLFKGDFNRVRPLELFIVHELMG